MRANAGTIDVLAVGQLFLDVVYTGLASEPTPGREIWTSEFGWGPGGIANQAVAASRLGASVAVAATVGANDPVSALVEQRLVDEGVRLAWLQRLPGWTLPVTAALELAGDRALVTGGMPSPLSQDEVLPDGPPRARTALAQLEPEPAEWISAAHDAGTLVIADLGWDPSEQWNPDALAQLDYCAAFVPNATEALAYTRADDVRTAAKALAERVPLVVVTRGGGGIVAVDSAAGLTVTLPALPVTAVDSTGAGDVFGAALAVALQQPWPLAEQLDFACLIAGLTVSRPGGAATAPDRRGLATWLTEHADGDTRARYRFVLDWLGTSNHPGTPSTTEDLA